MTNVTSTDFPGHYPGEDHAWSVDKFSRDFEVRFHKNLPYDATFDLLRLDASIANAFRRILLSEIPTLAIETVFIHNNTSIIQDEVLAARLGLVPLTGSLSGLRWLRYNKKPVASMNGPTVDDSEVDATDENTIVLKLKHECHWNESRKKGDIEPTDLYVGSNVYARDLVWSPVGQQVQRFSEEEGGGIRSTNPDILIAKMRPGQVLDLEMHAIKGIGADHAKFSPVATATYRLMPLIDIVKPILGDDARKFARCFPKGVIGLEEVTKEEAGRAGSGYEGMEGEKKAAVKKPERDTVSRECLRHEEFQGKVKLGRVRDHFIFSVESTGQFPSDLLFLESVKVLKAKCRFLRRNLDNVLR